MLVPQRQQSATISHSRIDMGAEHSGQAQANTSPSSQMPADSRRRATEGVSARCAGVERSAADIDPLSIDQTRLE
jgi:hypothetical protein